jgi:hypothetical protein
MIALQPENETPQLKLCGGIDGFRLGFQWATRFEPIADFPTLESAGSAYRAALAASDSLQPRKVKT